MKQLLSILLIIASSGVSAQNSFPHGSHNVIDSNYSKCEFDTAVYMPLYAGTDSNLVLAVAANGLLYLTHKGASGAGSGTVTNVGTGFGLNGGPVTTNGTLVVDTTTIETQTRAADTLLNYYTRAQVTTGLQEYLPISDSTIYYNSLYDADTSRTNIYMAMGGKQTQLSGTGFVKANGATISYDNTTYYPASNPDGYTSNTGTVTSIGVTGGPGISISGTSPVTNSGTFAITNTAPDQTVVLNGGAGISVTGTYPNFTIVNTSPATGGTVTSITAGAGLSGGTITSSGTISLPNTGTSGTYGSATQIPVFTTDAEGRVTNVTTVTNTPADASVTFTDITTNNSSTSNHGFLKKLSGTATQYMGGDGNWTTPAGTTYAAGIGLTLTSGTFNVNNSQSITTLSNLPGNGVVYTSGGAGTLNTGNLSGDVTTSGSLATTLKNTGTGTGSCSYCSVSFDAQGRQTTYSNGTTPTTSVTGTSPIVSSGGVTPTISFQNIAATSVPANTTGSSATPSGNINYSISGTSTSALKESDANANVSANSFIPNVNIITASSTAVTLNATSAQNQVVTGTSAQTIYLPVASTLSTGQIFYIYAYNSLSGRVHFRFSLVKRRA